jgi:hypothetical protein
MTFIILLRLLHVVSGVFWAGAVFFIASYLIPSVRDAGPDGAKVMQALQRRHVLEIIPAAAVLTILTGFMMYWRDAAGQAQWFRTPMAVTLGLGAVSAILGFVIGVLVMRASTIRAGVLAGSLGTLPQGPEKDARAAEVQRLRMRAASSARWVAALLGVAVACMAVARYVRFG